MQIHRQHRLPILLTEAAEKNGKFFQHEYSKNNGSNYVADRIFKNEKLNDGDCMFIAAIFIGYSRAILGHRQTVLSAI